MKNNEISRFKLRKLGYNFEIPNLIQSNNVRMIQSFHYFHFSVKFLYASLVHLCLVDHFDGNLDELKLLLYCLYQRDSYDHKNTLDNFQ